MAGPLARRKPGKFEIVSKGKTTEGGVIEVGQKKTAELSPTEASSGGAGNRAPSGGRGAGGSSGFPEGSGGGRPTGTEITTFTSQYGIWQQIRQQVSTMYGSFKGWWNSKSRTERIAWIVGTLAALGIPGWVLYEWLKKDADVDASDEMREATTSVRTGEAASTEVAPGQKADIAVVGDFNSGTSTTTMGVTGSRGDLVHLRDVIAFIKALRCEREHDEGSLIGRLTMEYDVYVRPKNRGSYVGGIEQEW